MLQDCINACKSYLKEPSCRWLVIAPSAFQKMKTWIQIRWLYQVELFICLVLCRIPALTAKFCPHTFHNPCLNTLYSKKPLRIKDIQKLSLYSGSTQWTYRTVTFIIHYTVKIDLCNICGICILIIDNKFTNHFLFKNEQDSATVLCINLKC